MEVRNEFSNFLTIIWPKHESNITQAQFRESIGNSLIKMNFLDPQYGRKFENLFSWLPIVPIFKILCLVCEPKKQFLWKRNDIALLFTYHGMGLAPKKTRKKFSSAKIKRPTRQRCSLSLSKPPPNHLLSNGNGSIQTSLISFPL